MQKISSALVQSLILLASILYLLSAGILFTGCAAQKKVAAHVVLERPCLTKIELSDHTRCTGPDANGLSCTGLVMTVKTNCGTLEVNQKEKK